MSPLTRLSFFRSSFQAKLFSIFTLLTASISIILCILYSSSEIRDTRINAHERIQMQARQLADSVRLPLYAENRAVLQQLAAEAVKTPEMYSVVITANDGRILAEARLDNLPATTELFRESAEVRSLPLPASVESVFSGSHNTGSTLIGAVHMERGTSDLSRKVRRVIVISVSVAASFWLAVTGFCYLVLRRLTSSFNALMLGITAMQEGDFTSRIEIESDDEPGRAAHAINNLACVLQQRGEENNRLQEERLDIERQMFHAQKLESLGIMAGGIAHDFNNLLQSILGNIELASLKLTPDAPAHKFIDRAISSTRRAALLTGLMLTYVGKGVITKKDLNLNELVRRNVDMLRTAASSSVSIELHLSPELPVIAADEAHIQQVVMNLISNAAESIVDQPGFIKLTTSVLDYDKDALSASVLDEKPEPGRFVVLEVKDNGCGMNEETLKRLFDPFFTTKFTGRGLGMSAVMGIMRTHHGALLVESKPDKGTTFKVLFPATIPTTPAAASGRYPQTPLSTKIKLPENQLSGLALVVDDEKAVLHICSKMVSLCGLTVISAVDGVDAVAKFREHADDIVVVLMDLTMPNMDGIAAMSKIHLIKPDIKIIISSGFNKEELSERLTEHPPDGFIRKPYSLNVLELELRRILQG